jgi:CBS domain-containing protein
LARHLDPGQTAKALDALPTEIRALWVEAINPVPNYIRQHIGNGLLPEDRVKVRDKMTRNARLIGPETTIREAAHTMAECDAGALPVAKDNHLVGMVTDRDIAVRAIAKGKGPDIAIVADEDRSAQRGRNFRPLCRESSLEEGQHNGFAERVGALILSVETWLAVALRHSQSRRLPPSLGRAANCSTAGFCPCSLTGV